MSTADESWYFTQSGERKGPVSLDLLSELVAKEKLNGESDLVWGPNLNDWTKAGEVEGLKSAYAALAEAKAAAEVVAAAQAAVVAEEPKVPVAEAPQVSPEPPVEKDVPPPPPSVPVPTAVVEQKAQQVDDDDLLAQAMDARREKREKEIGLSRGKFLGGSFALHLIGGGILIAIYASVFAKLGGDLSATLGEEAIADPAVQKGFINASMMVNVVSLVIGLATLLMVFSRLKNLGMSRWNFLWNLVPIASIWINYRIVACPAGYAESKKLDGPGKLLAFVYFASIILPIVGIGALGFAISSGALGELPDLEPLLKQLQELEQLKQGPASQNL